MRTEDAVKALVLVARAREDSRGMTEESFKSQICSPLLAKAAWVKSMRSMFGKAIDTPATWP